MKGLHLLRLHFLLTSSCCWGGGTHRRDGHYAALFPAALLVINQYSASSSVDRSLHRVAVAVAAHLDEG